MALKTVRCSVGKAIDVQGPWSINEATIVITLSNICYLSDQSSFIISYTIVF